MDNPTMDQIKKLTPEELAELHRKLGKRAMKQMLLLFGFKWAAIIAISVGVQKLVESRLDDKTETN